MSPHPRSAQSPAASAVPASAPPVPSTAAGVAFEQVDRTELLDKLGLADRTTLAAQVPRPFSVEEIAAIGARLGVSYPKGSNLLAALDAPARYRAAVLAEIARLHPEVLRPDEPGAAYPSHDLGRKNLRPVRERLAALLERIPDAEKSGGLSLESLRRRLVGKFGRTASYVQVAEALRELGWVRVRSWQHAVAVGFAARWFPPGAVPDHDRRRMGKSYPPRVKVATCPSCATRFELTRENVEVHRPPSDEEPHQ